MNERDLYDSNSRFDKSNIIHETAIIYDNVIMGKNNIIGAFTVIGSNGEMRGVKQEDFQGFVKIGDNNVISELVTIQRPFEADKGTFVGNNNIIMAHSHMGHDSIVENNCEICTGTIIGGYAIIKNGAKIKVGCTIRNRKVIGENALIGMGAVVVKDIEANKIVFGNPAHEK